MNPGRREMLAALAALSLVAGAPEAGLQVNGLDQELPQLARQDDSYEQMVLDYVEAIRQSTPEAWFDGTKTMAAQLLRAEDPALWEPYDPDNPLRVDFVEPRSLTWDQFDPDDNTPPAHGWFWPGERHAEIDPHRPGKWETEATTLHELSHIAVDDRFGDRGPQYQEDEFVHGDEWEKLLRLATERVDIPRYMP